jgi:acyl-coenzyme A thioesterase PaaI-like protein
VSDGEEPTDRREPPVSVRIEGLRGLPQTHRRAELRRLAAAARRLIEHLVSTTASDEQLTAAADQLDEVAALFESLPRGSTYLGFSEAANAGSSMRDHLGEQAPPSEIEVLDGESVVDALTRESPEFFAVFDHSPFIGLANPLSPPVELSQESERVVGRVTFGAAYEGPPGCVHGGYVAAVFDELLGAAQSLAGTAGMTARLEIDYRRPTPLQRPLVLEGWLDSTEGRKTWATGVLRLDEPGPDGGAVLAEARALFVSFDVERFRELLDARDRDSED